MQLDTRTLLACGALVTALHGAVGLVLSFQYPGMRALRKSGLALLVFVAGLIAMAFRGAAPDFVSVALANTLTVAAVVLLEQAIRVSTERKIRDPFGWTLVGVTFLAQCVLVSIPVSGRLQTVFASSVFAVLTARAALSLHQPVPRGARAAYSFTEDVFWAAAFSQVARGVAAFLTPVPTDPLSPDALQTVAFAITLVLLVSGSMGFLWMEFCWLNEELVRLATYDALTGCLNRNAFLAECEAELDHQRSGGVFSLVVFDLDEFKRVNDTYGHPVGDRVLCAVTDAIRGCLRKADVVGRMGGEEIAVLLVGLDRDDAARAAERAREAVAQTRVAVNAKQVRVTISGGISTYPIHGDDVKSLLSAADVALYRAKRGGRNRIAFATPGVRDAASPTAVAVS